MSRTIYIISILALGGMGCKPELRNDAEVKLVAGEGIPPKFEGEAIVTGEPYLKLFAKANPRSKFYGNLKYGSFVTVKGTKGTWGRIVDRPTEKGVKKGWASRIWLMKVGKVEKDYVGYATVKAPMAELIEPVKDSEKPAGPAEKEQEPRIKRIAPTRGTSLTDAAAGDAAPKDKAEQEQEKDAASGPPEEGTSPEAPEDSQPIEVAGIGVSIGKGEVVYIEKVEADGSLARIKAESSRQWLEVDKLAPIYAPPFVEETYEDEPLPNLPDDKGAAVVETGGFSKRNPRYCSVPPGPTPRPFSIIKTSRAQRALLSIIGYGEGTSSCYNFTFKFRRFKSYNDHPRICIRFWWEQKQIWTCSSAAGRYQYVRKTWDTVKSKLRLKNFSPASQDRGALYLVRGTKVNPKRIIRNYADFMVAMRKMGNEWASLPGSKLKQRTVKGLRAYCYYRSYLGNPCKKPKRRGKK